MNKQKCALCSKKKYLNKQAALSLDEIQWIDDNFSAKEKRESELYNNKRFLKWLNEKKDASEISKKKS